MKDYIFDSQGALFGERKTIGFGDKEFNIKEIPREKANNVIINNHYSKKFYSASYIHLGVFIENELKGVLQLGYAMNPASQEGVVKDTKIDEYLELNRMWIDDSAGKNSESKAISYAIKYIKRKYPKIKWIQSFADERCKLFGIVYQAANFKYLGEHKAIFWTLDGETFHNSVKTSKIAGPRGYDLLNNPENKDRVQSETLRQFRYLYFIKGSCQKNLVLTIKDYPKHYAV